MSGSPRRGHYGQALLAILLLSVLLRGFLVLSGGQNYWPDEVRYQNSRLAARALWAGDTGGFLRTLNRPEHFLFRVIGVIPATLEVVVGENPKIPAVFFSLFSVASLLLMWAILRRIGENERVALFAVGLLGLSSSFLYYSRHLLPYDMAMAFGLLALFVGLRTPLRAIDSIACGLLSACAFLTYNGYWTLAAFAMLAQAFRRPRSLGACLRRGFLSGVSFALPCAALFGAGMLAGRNFVQQLIVFSNAVSQGSYAEGWSLPLAYFWHAEHLLVLLWVAALAYGVREVARGSRNEALLLGVLGVLWVYGCLFLFSVVLRRLVVYGRLARQMVPFFCILTGVFLERIRSSSSRGSALVWMAGALAACQAIVNFHRPVTQVFFPEFRRMAAEASAAAGPGDYEVLFAEFIYPLPPAIPVPPGRIILARPHPLEFLPFQYEGWTPEERSAVRASDIRMRLLRKAQR